MIILQRGQGKARFRVIWTRRLAPSELQAGIECTEPDKNIWGFDLDDQNEIPGGGTDREFLMKILQNKK
jgi:hypothetical protein